MSQAILIVEDHKGVRTALRDWLLANYPQNHVIEAGSGEEAISLVDRETPRLVIMDFKLPGIDGVEVTRRIKARFPQIPVVMLTVREGEVYRTYAAAAGVSAYLPKRLVLTELSTTLEPWLSTGKSQF